MGATLKITCADHTSAELRALAGKCTDGAQVRRMLALALVLEGQVVTAPVIIGKIGAGRLRITLGPRDNAFELQKEAKDLVAVLRSQPLPAPLILMSEETVAPTR